MVHHRQRQLRNILKRGSELCKIDIDEYVWVLKSTFYVNDGISFLNLRFENDVKTYSIQTNRSSVMYILGQLLVYGLILFVIYLILS